MDIFSAIVAGLVGTLVISLVMIMSPRMGMPRMAIWELLGSMFNKDGNNRLGWLIHFLMGVVFALIYAWLWSIGIGAPTLKGGLLFGAVHWLVIGLAMAMVPMLHAGIRAGTVPTPGLYMTKQGGLMAFMGGLLGHMIFGAAVAWLYIAL